MAIAEHGDPTRRPQGSSAVRRRLILFVNGFDPRGERHTHKVFRQEFPKHLSRTGAKGEVGAIEASPPDKPWLKRWRLTRSDKAGDVETVFDFLLWQDLIPRRKPLRSIRLIGAGIATFFAMLANRIYPRMLGYSKSHCALGIFPFAMLAIYLLIMAWLVYAGFHFLAPYGAAFAVLGIVVGALAAALFYWVTVKIEQVVFVWFALTLWNFQWRHGGRGMKAVDERLEGFAAHALEGLRDPAYDEVVVVALSTGGYYAIEMLGTVFDRDPKLAGRKLAFVTLGAQPSVTSWFGPRKKFVDALSRLLASPAVDWLVYHINGDIMSAARYDPVRDNGLDPTVFNPQRFIRHEIALKEMLKPETLAALRWRFLWLHLQYLMATETGEEHDFFAITMTGAPVLAAAGAWRNRAVALRRARREAGAAVSQQTA